jgi:hypothetical protein
MSAVETIQTIPCGLHSIAGCLSGLLIDPDDKVSTFLQNTGKGLPY